MRHCGFPAVPFVLVGHDQRVPPHGSLRASFIIMALSEKEKTDKVRLIARVFNSETYVSSKEFDHYDEGYNFLVGDQYTEKQKAYFRERQRPVNFLI